MDVNKHQNKTHRLRHIKTGVVGAVGARERVITLTGTSSTTLTLGDFIA